MRNFGEYLSNLRMSAGFSLDELATLVDYSKSAISRLENDITVPPFKGTARRAVISLGEILCTSQKETERYLQYAALDRTLLTEIEEIQLGTMPYVAAGSQNEAQRLERLEQIYAQLLKQLEERESQLGISKSPQNLKLKIQEYSNTLQEILKRLDKINGREEPEEPDTVKSVQVRYATRADGKLIVGHEHGADFCIDESQYSLYSLASPNARWLMQHADIECFAIDDCIMLANSRDFKGWEPQEIETTLLTRSFPIPQDLDTLRQEKLRAIENDYANGGHYRLVSFIPPFSEPKDILKVTLAPLNFFDYFSLSAFFDEQLLTAIDGSKISIREKYGNTALTYTATDKGTSLIPAPISIQCIVVTKDQQILLMRRSSLVAFYPNHWSASFEETMNAPIGDRPDNPERLADTDFFSGAIRGLEEEFAIPSSAVDDLRVLSLNVEYLTFSVDVITLIKLGITADEIRQLWLLKAWDKNEASKLALLPVDMATIITKLFNKTLWHPTSRMRLIQYLFHTYGIDAVTKAIKQNSLAE